MIDNDGFFSVGPLNHFFCGKFIKYSENNNPQFFIYNLGMTPKWFDSSSAKKGILNPKLMEKDKNGNFHFHSIDKNLLQTTTNKIEKNNQDLKNRATRYLTRGKLNGEVPGKYPIPNIGIDPSINVGSYLGGIKTKRTRTKRTRTKRTRSKRTRSKRTRSKRTRSKITRSKRKI